MTCMRPGVAAVHVAARPAGVPASAVSIGPDLRALAVYLVICQHVPVQRCAELIADMTGAQASAGWPCQPDSGSGPNFVKVLSSASSGR
jgi:hypothetical protein